MKRRAFVQRLPVLTTGLAAGASAALIGGCASVPYVVPRLTSRGLSLDVSELSPEGDVFVQAPGMSRPVYVRRHASGSWTAVLAECTHRGCQPEPVGDRLECPCHGSQFSFDGEVLGGPAERRLTRFEVSERDGEIVVRLPGGAR